MASVKDLRMLTNEELVYNLCCLMNSYKYLKGNIKEAKKIYDILEERGIVNNAEEAHRKWEERYSL